MHIRFAIAAVATMAACHRPPPAPEGLDESVRHLYREFHSSDALVSAGLTGLQQWFEEDGTALLDRPADTESIAEYTVSSLSLDDIDGLGLDERDPSLAAGAIAISSIPCAVDVLEPVYVRSDQHLVFEDTYDEYERTYESSREAFERATADEAFTPIEDAVDPFDPEFDFSPFEGSMLLTENVAQSSTLGIELESTLTIHLRHGVYEVDGEATRATLVFVTLPREAWSEGGESGLLQSYALMANIPADSGTLRFMAMWTEIDSDWFSSDSASMLTMAVNRAQDAAVRMGEICTGEIALPPEG